MIDYIKLKYLSQIWEKRKRDLSFYFEEMFDLSLEALKDNTEKSEKSICEEVVSDRYKELFMPVGYSLPNIVLVASFLKPERLSLGCSESTRRFFREHQDLIEKNLLKYNPHLEISIKVFAKDTQESIYQGVKKWIETASFSMQELAIDLTGGTKPMVIGAQLAAAQFQEINTFYLSVDYDDQRNQPVPGTEQLVRLIKDRDLVDKNLVFVIMPFSDSYTKIFRWIQEVVKDCGLTCLRADKDIFQGGIMDRVQENIHRAGLVIAELSERNPNVYYELGIAHERGKDVIMLAKEMGDIPFDLQHLRICVYNPGNKDDFTGKLKKEIKFFLKRK